jgi:hypothetical protein
MEYVGVSNVVVCIVLRSHEPEDHDATWFWYHMVLVDEARRISGSPAVRSTTNRSIQSRGFESAKMASNMAHPCRRGTGSCP